MRAATYQPVASEATGSAAHCDARVKLVCLVAYAIAALHAHTPVALAACVLAAVALGFISRLAPRALVAALRPLVVILLFTMVMQVLYIQQGAVLAHIGPVAITQGALEAASAMMIGLVCIMVASIAFMRTTASAELVSTFDWLCAPLRALGVRTAPFMLALSVAVRFVPVLVDEFGQLKRAQLVRHASFDGTVRQRIASYMRLFPPLVRSSFRRADRLAETFVARCFTGSARITLHVQRFHPRDIALAAATLAVVAFAFAC